MKRPLILAVPLALALAVTLGACGDDDDDDAPATTLAASSNTSPEVSITAESSEESPVDTSAEGADGGSSPGFTIPDSLPANIEEATTDFLAQFGLTDEQIDCVMQNVGGTGEPMPDMNSIMGLLDECGIELGDLQQGG